MKKIFGIFACTILLASIISCAALKTNKDIAPYLEKIEEIKTTVEPMSDLLYIQLLGDFRNYLVESKDKLNNYYSTTTEDVNVEIDKYYQELIDMVDEKLNKETN